MRRRSETGSTARTSSPSTVMLPESASISRFASRSSVVLPEPEPPTMARNSPVGDLERDVIDRQNGLGAAAAVKTLADMREGDSRRGGGHFLSNIIP